MNPIVQNADFTKLMDLRVDFAFKLLFAAEDNRPLISLLNAIFENKNIPRKITELTVLNPNLEKSSERDKLSILDIRAILSDYSQVCIEMHLYGLREFKHKSVRNWARVYGEELESGQNYQMQKPVICISFIDGHITDYREQPVKKVHALFQIMERDDHQLLLRDMEMHFINMKLFVETLAQEADPKGFDRFTQWLALITQKEIQNKNIIRAICEREEIVMVMETLVRMSEDKIKRQAYQRRMDEFYSFKRMLLEMDGYRAEVAESRMALDESRAEADTYRAQAAESDRQMRAMAQLLMGKGQTAAEIAAALRIPVQTVLAWHAAPRDDA